MANALLPQINSTVHSKNPFRLETDSVSLGFRLLDFLHFDLFYFLENKAHNAVQVWFFSSFGRSSLQGCPR
jgi:hypothetical protein